jgi:hypothetical protein
MAVGEQKVKKYRERQKSTARILLKVFYEERHMKNRTA